MNLIDVYILSSSARTDYEEGVDNIKAFRSVEEATQWITKVLRCNGKRDKRFPELVNTDTFTDFLSYKLAYNKQWELEGCGDLWYKDVLIHDVFRFHLKRAKAIEHDGEIYLQQKFMFKD